MNYIVLLCGIVVSMYDFGFCNEIFGSIPAGGIYFSAPIWHYFSMSELTVCLSGLYTVTPKTLSILTSTVVRCAHHQMLWESCLALVELKIENTVGYKIAP